MINVGNRLDERIAKFQDDFIKYGEDPSCMAMPSDRRNIRYSELLKHFDLDGGADNTHILDIGCGMGDVNAYLRYLGAEYVYLGIDLVEEFLNVGTKKYGSKDVAFKKLDYIRYPFMEDFVPDYAISSQTFNDPFMDGNNMEVIKDVMGRAFSICRKGISFNFVIDKVEFKNSNVAYHSPEEIMNWAYSLSHNVIMDNSCMPYECTCTILKDKVDNSIFETYRNRHKQEFEDGVFIVRKKN